VERVISLKGANDGIFLDDELVFEDGQDPTSLGKKFHMMNWCIFVCYARIRKTFELTLVSQVDDVGEGTAGIDGRNGEL